MSNTPRALGGFPILALHPKSLRQIGELGFFGTNSGSINEPLMGGSFFVGNGEGIEALAKPIFIRGAAPSMEAALPSALALYPKWIRWLGCAARARGAPAAEGASPLRRLAKPMRLPPKLPIVSLIPCGVKCQRILSFPKNLFYSLAALRIK